MDPSLRDKVAIVTGGSGGIGRAVASRLAAEGTRVAVTYHTRQEEARAWVKEAAAAGLDGVALPLDLRDPAAPRALVDEVKEKLGEVHILVNNAGVRRDGAIFVQEEEDWKEVLQTHLEGAYRMVKSVIVPMMKSRSGVILNVGSVSGLIGTPGQTNYSAAKAGLVGFTKALAREVAPRGVRVNALALGLIDAGMTDGLDENLRERIRGEIPLGRLGTAEEAASAALFLLSDRSAYITGQVVPVDGGLT